MGKNFPKEKLFIGFFHYVVSFVSFQTFRFIRVYAINVSLFKVLIRQVFKFLLAVSKTPLYDDAIEALGELWQLNQWLINEKG